MEVKKSGQVPRRTRVERSGAAIKYIVYIKPRPRLSKFCRICTVWTHSAQPTLSTGISTLLVPIEFPPAKHVLFPVQFRIPRRQ